LSCWRWPESLRQPCPFVQQGDNAEAAVHTCSLNIRWLSMYSRNIS
jgi:hypothetical protein